MNRKHFEDTVRKIADHLWDGLRDECPSVSDVKTDQAANTQGQYAFTDAFILALAHVIGGLLCKVEPSGVDEFLSRLSCAVYTVHLHIVAENHGHFTPATNDEEDEDTIGPTAGNA